MFNAIRILSVWGAALWLGGVIAIGAFAAPTAFHTIATWPGVSDPKVLAGKIIGNTLRHFNVLCIAAIAFMILDTALSGRDGKRVRSFGPIFWINSVCVALLAVSVATLIMVIFPALDAAQISGEMVRFVILHHSYEIISELQVLPLVILLSTWTVAQRRH